MRRRRLLVYGACAALIVVLAVLFLLIGRQPEPADEPITAQPVAADAGEAALQGAAEPDTGAADAEKAIETLPLHPKGGDLDQLLTLVLYKKVSNMEDALRFLGTDPDFLVPLLMARLDSETVLERQMAVWVAVCMFPDGRFLPFAEKAMRDEDAKARVYAMQFFGATGLTSPETEKIVRDILKNDEDMKARDVAVLFYTEQCGNHPEWIDDDLSNALSGLLSTVVPQDADTMGMRAAWVLAMTSKGGPETVEALKAAYLNGKDAEGNVRSVAVAAAAALARRGRADFDVKEFLLANLTDKDEVVVASSIVGLSNFADDPKVRQAVAAAVPMTGRDAEYRHINRTYEAIVAYAKAVKQDEDLAAACARALASPPHDQGARLIEAWMGAALANLGKKEGAEALLRLATEGEPNLDHFRVGVLGDLRRVTGRDYPLRPNAYPLIDSEVQTWRKFIDENYK